MHLHIRQDKRQTDTGKRHLLPAYPVSYLFPPIKTKEQTKKGELGRRNRQKVGRNWAGVCLNLDLIIHLNSVSNICTGQGRLPGRNAHAHGIAFVDRPSCLLEPVGAFCHALPIPSFHASGLFLHPMPLPYVPLSTLELPYLDLMRFPVSAFPGSCALNLALALLLRGLGSGSFLLAAPYPLLCHAMPLPIPTLPTSITPLPQPPCFFSLMSVNSIAFQFPSRCLPSVLCPSSTCAICRLVLGMPGPGSACLQAPRHVCGWWTVILPFLYCLTYPKLLVPCWTTDSFLLGFWDPHLLAALPCLDIWLPASSLLTSQELPIH